MIMGPWVIRRKSRLDLTIPHYFCGATANIRVVNVLTTAPATGILRLVSDNVAQFQAKPSRNLLIVQI